MAARSFLAAAALAAVGAAVPCHLSNTFGDHLVLQRQPAAAMLFGFADVGTTVKTVFSGTTYTSTADATGVWRQALPPQPATQGSSGVSITFSCSSGEKFALADVLFGEVVVCGGQSKFVRPPRALPRPRTAARTPPAHTPRPARSLTRAACSSPWAASASSWATTPLRRLPSPSTTLPSAR